MTRLRRAVRWYRRLRRDPLDTGYFDFQLPRSLAWRIAWYWSKR